MKKSVTAGRSAVVIFLLLTVVLLSLPSRTESSPAAAGEDPARLVSGIHWLGHDAFRIEAGGLMIYIDPYGLKSNLPKADLILATHEHFDHTSPADIAKIMKSDTVIVTIGRAAEKLTGNIRTIKPGEHITVKGIAIRAVPAYNIDKFRSPGVPYHPKESGHAGYILAAGGVRIYHAGDTDFIPEMKGLAPDVALLPVTGTYVMTVEEAVRAAAAIKPRVAVPMHVGGPVGSLKSAEEFKARATVPVVILPIEK